MGSYGPLSPNLEVITPLPSPAQCSMLLSITLLLISLFSHENVPSMITLFVLFFLICFQDSIDLSCFSQYFPKDISPKDLEANPDAQESLSSSSQRDRMALCKGFDIEKSGSNLNTSMFMLSHLGKSLNL